MTDKQPEPEYIITESQLESLELIAGDIATNGGENDQRIILAYIKDRPYHPAPEHTDCPYHSSVFYNGDDKTKPMAHHCDFLNNSFEMDEKRIRQSEREKSDKIFDHTIALCEVLIERFDSQSQLGFNALIIKRDIESLRRKVE